MITALELYMDKLYTALAPMPPEERLALVRETAQRIRERAQRLNTTEEKLIADMEAPEDTARKFVARWQAQQAPQRPQPETQPEEAQPVETTCRDSCHATGLGKALLGLLTLFLLLPVVLVPLGLVLGGVLLPITGIIGGAVGLFGRALGSGMAAFGHIIGLLIRLAIAIFMFKVGLRVLRAVLRGLRSLLSI